MDNVTNSNSIVAIFSDRNSAEHARDELFRNGFGSDQVHLTASDELTKYVGSGGTGLSGEHYDTSGGGISGFFHRLFHGHDRDRDSYYAEATRPGRCAIVVDAQDESIDRAADILNRNGALDVEDRTETESRTDKIEARDKSRGESIPVVKEDLQVGKRAVRRGGVRVYSNLREQPVEKTVPLREEHVRVDRRPADRPATDADMAAADRGVIEIHETAEEPVVEKSARVVEEVVVSKDVRERNETVRDTVRRNDVKIEDAKDARRESAQIGNDYDTDFRNDFRTRYGSTARYEDYEPAYRYGYDMASDPRYRGRSFSDVENDLRSDYTRRYPNSTWDRIKESVRYGWDRVTGRR